MKKPVILGILLMILLGAILLSAGCSGSTTVSAPATPAMPPPAATPPIPPTTPPSTAPAPTSSTTLPSVAMVTDKTQYASGERVKLTVTNGMDVPAYYINYTQPDLVFWELERSQNSGWQHVDFRLPMTEGGGEVCRILLYERPVGAVTELKPRMNLLYVWDQKICPLKMVTGPFEPEIIERGRYRFALRCSLDTVKSENIEAEPWKRPIELGDITMVYSNEFVLA